MASPNIKFNVFEHQNKNIDLMKYNKYLIHNGYSRPIMLIVETVNICNNNCIICAYSKTTRKKGIMNQEVFKKILFDYDEIGGGGLSLTPVVGEIFLDKDLVTRFKEIQKHPMITDVSFTTNVVRSFDLDDQDLCFILQNTLNPSKYLWDG